VAGNTVMLARRTGGKKESLPMAGLSARLQEIMDAMQRDLLEVSRARRESNSIRGASKEQFLAAMRGDGGFVYAGFCGEGSCEAAIKEETKATIRVLPDEEFRSPERPTTCMWCGTPATTEALWAKAY
jgi:prolyl-tRNA synthetase